MANGVKDKIVQLTWDSGLIDFYELAYDRLGPMCCCQPWSLVRQPKEANRRTKVILWEVEIEKNRNLLVVVSFFTLVIARKHLPCDNRVFSLWLPDKRHHRGVEFCERIMGSTNTLIRVIGCEIFGIASWQVDVYSEWNEQDRILKIQL